MTNLKNDNEEIKMEKIEKPKRGRPKKKVVNEEKTEVENIIEQSSEIEEPKNVKNKGNIIVFFIKLLVIFSIFDFINPFIYRTIGRAIIFGKFGQEIILEAVCFAIILVVLLLAGNKYVITQKKDNFLTSLGVGGAMFGFAILLTIVNIKGAIEAQFYDVISLGLYCLFIGLFEEFMCRGWIQNELTERYSQTRNQAILSIALSSLIFGGMHISNIWIGGQGVIETLSQVIQATGMGIYLGAIYYRTKNIWANVFLHGFWDFGILLGEMSVIKACSEGNASNSYIISQLTVSILFLIIYTLLGLYILRKSKLTGHYNYQEEEIKLSEKRKDRLIFIVVILYMLIGYTAQENENQVCYTYEEKPVIYTELVSPKYNEYYFTDNNVKIKLYLDDEKLKIKNLDSNYESVVSDKNVQNFIVVKNKEQYHLLIVGLNEYESDTELYYTSYFNSSIFSNEPSFLDNVKGTVINIDSAPSVKELGYFYSYLDDTTYPYIVSHSNDTLILHNNELYTIKEENYESFVENTK